LIVRNLKLEKVSNHIRPKFTVGKQILYIGLTLFFFLLSLRLLVHSLGLFSDSFQENFLISSLNPFIGLFIGLLVTAIIQSSSTTTTMVVAIMAAGGLEIRDAIPIIMGANIGTTLTSTIVALGFISDAKEFRKAISAGIIHDFFNILLVIVLFPFEYYFGVLSGLSSAIQEAVVGVNGISSANEVSFGFDFGLAEMIADSIPGDILTVVCSFILLFTSIKLLTRVIQQSVIGSSKNKLRRYIFEKPFKSFGWGLIFTAAIQSSSVTTALVVPLVATSKVRLINAFPFILGANLGTTITALIAASFSSEAALSIAIFHLLFNLIGVVLFMVSGVLRKLFVDFTKKFSITITKRRIVGLAYVLVTFFLLPFILICLHDGQKKNENSGALSAPVEETLDAEKKFIS